MAQIQLKQLGFALGAEVTGIDLAKPLNDLARREILEAWHLNLVLVFPGQDLSAEAQIAFSRNFGELEDNESQPYYRDPEHREILLVTNKEIGGKPSETRNTGRNWHADLEKRDPEKVADLRRRNPPVAHAVVKAHPDTGRGVRSSSASASAASSA